MRYGGDRLIAHRVRPAQTIVVSGFWRSGTTWLQQSLADMLEAKTIFEPLHLTVPGIDIFYPKAHGTMHWDYYAVFMPFHQGRLEDSSAEHKFFEEALRGMTPGRWVRRLRSGVILESRHHRVVLKMVRGQLLLRALYDTFSLPIVYITRDPRAIVASLTRSDRRFTFWDDISLVRQLLEPDDGRRNFFSQWEESIRRIDREDNIARLTAYWALTELYVRYSFADRREQVIFMSYEDLCREREEVVRRIIEQVGVPGARARGVMDQDSGTTEDDRLGASIEARIYGWKNELSASQINQVESTATLFGLEDRLFSGQIV